MHRSYQPLKPATNRYLQQRWDQEDYENHRRKVSRHWGEGQPDGMKTFNLHTHTSSKLLHTSWLFSPVQVSTALPVVDNKGMKTPAHIQLKLKKLQVSFQQMEIFIVIF